MQEIAYFGGAYRVLTSQEKDLRVNLDALLTATEYVGTKAQRDPIKRTIRSVLALSDAMLRKAGLARGTGPGDASKPTIPAEAELDRLSSVVLLTLDEVDSALRAFGCSSTDLDPLMSGLERHELTTIDAEGRPLRSTPFVRFGARLAIPAPSLIVPALARAIATHWLSAGLRAEFAAALQRFAVDSVSESLSALGAEALEPSTSPLPLQIGRARWYRMDADKVLVSLVLSDPFADDEAFWQVPKDALTDALMAIEAHELAKSRPANALLILLTIQSYFRPYVAPLPVLQYARVLPLSAGDLETIRSTREVDPLALWAYVEARERTTTRTQIVASDPLDEFAMYQSLGKSFRFTDEATPDLIAVSPGTALTLRMEAFAREDLHPLPDPEGRVGTYVRTQQDVPIYGRIRPLDPLQMLVELPEFTAFISVEQPEGVHRAAQYELTELVSYWVWQIARECALRFAAMVVKIHIPEPTSDAWESGIRPDHSQQEPGVQVRIARDVLHVDFGPHALVTFDAPDNAGERLLVSGLVAAMFEVTRDERLDNSSLERVVDQVAPLGHKKKLVILSSDEAVMRLDTRGLPPPRRLQESASQHVRAELIPELLRTQGVPVGVIDPTKRETVLKALVEELFSAFRGIVGSLRGEGLLQRLLVMDDALFTEYERQRRLIPTEMACFADIPSAEERLADTVPRIVTTSLAHRFLIEYVAAQPPNGLRPFSLAVYDELIAIAAEFILLANDDDLLHYGLVPDLGLEVRPDGRLAKDEGVLALARDAFSSAYAAQELRRAIANFPRMWGRPSDTGDDEHNGLPEQVDQAFRAEFGWSLQELALVWRVLLELQVVSGSPQPFTPAEVAAAIDAECKCGTDRALDLVISLALSPRDDFEAAPHGFTIYDVLPWRFSRALSLLRRPLVSSTAEGEEVLYWTRKGVLRASEHLINAVFDRRLKPRSPEMATLMGELGVEEGKSWLGVVERAVRERVPLVRTNVDRVGSLRLIEQGRNLGDFDVLAYDERRSLLWGIEVKNFEPARTPYEARSELLDFEEAVKKHQARLDWLHANRIAVSTALLGRAPVTPVGTRGSIVVSNESLVRHLRTFGLTVSTLPELLDELDAGAPRGSLGNPEPDPQVRP